MHTSTRSSWQTGVLFPALPPPESLDIYNIQGAAPEVRLTVTALAGLINRGPAKIYLIKGSPDEFWLKEIDPALPRTRPDVAPDALLTQVVSTYHAGIEGLIIYDPALPASINVATTLAGLRAGLIVTPEQADSLQGEPFHLPVLDDLRSYGWKNSLQAYAWAYQHLLPECSDTLVAGLDPRIPDCLRSFLVTHRVFTCWLDARNVLPHITQGLLCERGLLKRLLSSFAPGSLHLGWFVNEQLGIRLTSRAALLTYASDYCTNFEIWNSLPAPSLPEEAISTSVEEDVEMEEEQESAEIVIVQESELQETDDSPAKALSHEELVMTLLPTQEEKEQQAKIYLSFTFSDGDNLQYCQNRLLQIWNDKARGSLPMGWTISPALQQAMPTQAAFYRRSASANDEFIASPSGIAYILPSCFPRTHRDAFFRMTAEYMQNMQLHFIQVLDSGTLFSMKLIDYTLQELIIKHLASAGLRGIFSGWGTDYPSWASHPRALFIYHNLGNLGLPLDATQIARLIQEAAARGKQFIHMYLFAWNATPSDLQSIMDLLGEDFCLVKPGRLLELLGQEQ